MHIKTEMSRENVIRNGRNRTLVVGRYCWLHDANYKVVQGNEVCPRCEKWQQQDLDWRDEEDAQYNSGDDMGDEDEE